MLSEKNEEKEKNEKWTFKLKNQSKQISSATMPPNYIPPVIEEFTDKRSKYEKKNKKIDIPDELPGFKSLGSNQNTIFKCPVEQENNKNIDQSKKRVNTSEITKSKNSESKDVHPDLEGLDEKHIEMIERDIFDDGKISRDEIAGLESVKDLINRSIICPIQRPDLFLGPLAEPPKGILLFGPPGTGKTLLAKWIATEAMSTFFSISSATLTSKWMGEGEKLCRTLFAVAKVRQPSVIFLDEVDSLLSARSDKEDDSTRRLKTQLLQEMQGTKESDARIVIVAATNRPEDIDEAARRRFTKRVYVPLPDESTRKSHIIYLLKKHHTDNDIGLTELQINLVRSCTRTIIRCIKRI
eukprot:GHVL01031895.1.p1 GENE.GHVL01031895.1~~GHVL01031895.1.p1  ORF type:complete len:354 (+),score=105.31 GHVL01031895.1:579-1640(+)